MPNSPITTPVLREDLPLYPPLIQLLRVTSARVAGPAGIAQVAGSSVLGPTLYVAFTQQLRTDGLIPRDREPCLADDVNDAIKGNPGFPGFFLGRLAGSYDSLPVYEIIGSSPATSSGSGVVISLAKCLAETHTSGRYDAVLMDENADGTLTASLTSVWIREGNVKDRLINGEVYFCKKTGTSTGRDVYTCVDFNLTVRNEGGGTSFSQIYRLLFGPDNNWSITQSETRRTLIKRLLSAKETGGVAIDDLNLFTFDPAVSWEVEAGAANEVIIRRLLTIQEGGEDVSTNTWRINFNGIDFDLTGSGQETTGVFTNGYTGEFYVLTACTAGVLRKRLLTFTRGLLKEVGGEIDA